MEKMITVKVVGVPVPAGSKKAFVVKGKPVVVDTSGSKGREWRNTLQGAALAESKRINWEPTREPLALRVEMYVPRPKSHLNSKDQVRESAPKYPAVRPDITKLVRAIEDALTGILWHDDAQIVQQCITKKYSAIDRPPAVIITAEVLHERDTERL